MKDLLVTFAAQTNSSEGDLLGALGINWQLLIVQVVSFLILVAILAKFVYPVLNRSLDKREKAIRGAADAAEKARNDAAAAEKRIASELAAAKKQAAETIDLAHKESAAMLAAAEEKAKKRADHIVETAHAQLEQDTAAARAALQKDVKRLVADATETIIGTKLDAKTDQALIEKALKESERAGK